MTLCSPVYRRHRWSEWHAVSMCDEEIVIVRVCNECMIDQVKTADVDEKPLSAVERHLNNIGMAFIVMACVILFFAPEIAAVLFVMSFTAFILHINIIIWTGIVDRKVL